MRTIYLVRHGVPDFPNGKSIVQGCKMDFGINPLCKKDAATLSVFFKDKSIENWYSSPLKRAQQTLDSFIPQDKTKIILKDAEEVHLGRWEGKSWAENKLQDPKLFIKRKTDNTIVPEDAEQLASAAERFKNAVLSTQGNCVIATHWVIISTLYCITNNFPLSKYLDLPHAYLGISKIIEDNGKLHFEYVGQRLTPCPECEKLEKLLASQHNDGKI